MSDAEKQATERLVAAHRAEYDRLLSDYDAINERGVDFSEGTKLTQTEQKEGASDVDGEDSSSDDAIKAKVSRDEKSGGSKRAAKRAEAAEAEKDEDKARVEDQKETRAPQEEK